MRKVNMNALDLHQVFPEDGDLFPLRDGIGRDKCCLDICFFNEICSHGIPPRYIIQYARSFILFK